MKMNQILHIFLSNALKFSNEGPVIMKSTFNYDLKNDWVDVKVGMVDFGRVALMTKTIFISL